MPFVAVLSSRARSDRARRAAAPARRLVRRRGLAAAVGGLGIAALLLGPEAAGASTRPAPARVARPAHLVQAANSKTTCIYAALGGQFNAAKQTTGVNFRCLEAFDTSDNTWSEWTAPWITNSNYGYTQWVAADPSQHTLVITKDLVPSAVSSADPNWRLEGARGRYDKYIKLFAANLVKAGFGDAVIRLGPEMNGPWETDWIGSTPALQRQWALYFGRIVRIMRRVNGAHFLFDWNVNAAYEDIPLANYYPGNAYVDIVGIDAYDESPIPLPPVGAPTRWYTLATEPLGLDQITEFAVAHGKPISIPEWGTLSTHGDDGDYVAHIGQYVQTHDVAYQAYYDANDENIYPLGAIAPQTLGNWLRAFGPSSELYRYQAAYR